MSPWGFLTPYSFSFSGHSFWTILEFNSFFEFQIQISTLCILLGRNCGGWKNILGFGFCQPCLDYHSQMLWLSWVMLIDTVSESSARLVVDFSTCMYARTHSHSTCVFFSSASLVTTFIFHNLNVFSVFILPDIVSPTLLLLIFCYFLTLDFSVCSYFRYTYTDIYAIFLYSFL